MNKNFSIEQITPELTWDLRQSELYPGFPISEIKLKEDYYGLHFGLFTDNKLVSIVSLFEKEGGKVQLRKFATSKNYQGKGYGTEMMNYIVNLATKQGKNTIWCNVRLTAINFYKKFNFQETDETFTRKGIDYVIMEKQLNKQ